jgi:hypothetical protein
MEIFALGRLSDMRLDTLLQEPNAHSLTELLERRRKGYGNPRNEQLKQIGHDLIVLYEKYKTLATEQSLDSTEWSVSGSIEHEMLALLSGFAKRSRYTTWMLSVEAKRRLPPRRMGSAAPACRRNLSWL